MAIASDPLRIVTEEERMVRESLDKAGLTPPEVPGWKLKPMTQSMFDAIGDVIAERARQDDKWGADRDMGEQMWLAILAEEFGEIAKAMLDADMALLRTELAQVAAVCVAWLEMYVRESEAEREAAEDAFGPVAADVGTDHPAVIHAHVGDGTVRSLS